MVRRTTGDPISPCDFYVCCNVLTVAVSRRDSELVSINVVDIPQPRLILGWVTFREWEVAFVLINYPG